MTHCPTRGRALVLSLLILLLLTARPAAARAATLDYWIAAVPVAWDAAPNGRDPITGRVLAPSARVVHTIVYRRYTAGWRTPFRNRPDVSADNDGIPGPLIRGRVRDVIRVHFRNGDTLFHRPHSMHFHGVRYAFDSDGSYIPGFSGPGANVRPGHSFTYRLVAQPTSVGVWPYHDHSPSMTESIAGGLYGALSILGRHEQRPTREFVVALSSLMSLDTIDGRAFLGNTPVFHARVGDLVQWDVIDLGESFHTFHVHGHRWRDADGTSRDTRTIGPAESFRVRWRETEPGAWLYHCHVESHMMNGMIGLYRVSR